MVEKQVMILMDEQLKDESKTFAKNNGMTLSSLIRLLLRKIMDNPGLLHANEGDMVDKSDFSALQKQVLASIAGQESAIANIQKLVDEEQISFHEAPEQYSIIDMIEFILFTSKPKNHDEVMAVVKQHVIPGPSIDEINAALTELKAAGKVKYNLKSNRYHWND
jgi:antitoxin component of RelBE/YafQ-DinJ toxin-antitoxin module